MVGPTGSVAPPLRIVLGVPAGVVATLAMDVAMARLAEGGTPPRVASGVLTDRGPDAAPARLATAVHYVAGLLTGPLYVTLLLFAEAALGPSPAAYALSAGVLFVLMVAFFTGVVLPRAGFPGARRRQVGRAWAVEAAVYVAVLAGLTVGASALVAGL